MNYPKFLGRAPDDGSHTWFEWEVQSWIATQCHRAGIIFSAGMEGSHKGKAGGAKAKATGQVSGEPDLRFYLPQGRLVLIELKVVGGALSPSQIKRHAELRKLGFPVAVVFAISPVAGWEQVRAVLVANGMELEEYYGGNCV